MSCSFLDNINEETIEKAYAKNGYDFFSVGDFNLNIFGIRADENTSNTFNDCICMFYKAQGIWTLFKTSATTDPGLFYRENPCNVNGTAILVPGQYKGGWRLGKHQGKYDALVQNKPVDLYRDNNKDGALNRTGKIYHEMAGINIHRATAIEGKTSVQVDKWSAGCQVMASKDDFDTFMRIVTHASKLYGEVFTYTLFTEGQFFS